MLTLRWSTFAPIDLGARLRGSVGERALDALLIQEEWLLRASAQDETAILGADTAVFERAQHTTAATLYLLTAGFVVFRLDGGPVRFDTEQQFSAPVHLRNRRHRHRGLLRLDHYSLPADNFDAFVTRMRKSACAETPRHLRRLDDSRVLHYVMSIYFLDGCSRKLSDLSPHLLRQLKACLDPGIVSLDDTPFLADGHDSGLEDAKRLVNQIAPTDSGLTPVELADDVTVLASWSSVFIVGHIESADRRLAGALQARIQSAWLAAWSVGDLSRRLVADVEDREISARRVEAIAFELGYLENEAAARLDASLSTRLERVWKLFVETSGLGLEWQRASLALSHARGYAEFVNRDANYRFQIAFETLLLLFAVAQLAPLVLTLPIKSLDSLESQWTAVASLLLILVAGIALIARRRR